MKALVLEKVNQTMILKEMLLSSSIPDAVVINVKHAAINHRDLWIYKGMYAGIKLPVILGSDLCGSIDNEDVIVNPAWFWGVNEAFQSGNFEVLGMPHDGSFAELIQVPKSFVYSKPDHLSTIEAAALPLAGLTAYRALFVRAKLKKGDSLLITGIGGGVALMALKMAVAFGIKTYVTSGSDDKIEKATKLGAVGGVNYKKNNWRKLLSEMMENDGFDVILDSAGGDGFGQLLKLTNYGARIAVYGGTRGNYSSVNPQIIFWKQISILGTTMGSDKDFKGMLNFVNEYKVIPVVDKVFFLSDANLAFDRMDKGNQFGKIILDINSI